MSRPPIRTYGKPSRTPSSSDNPFGLPSSPFSFRLDTPPSSPPLPPAKRARITPPSSPLFARTLANSDLVDENGGLIQNLGDGERLAKEDTEVEEKPVVKAAAAGKLEQSTLKGFFSAQPKSKPALSRPSIADIKSAPRTSVQPLEEASRTINLPLAPQTTQLRLTHLPLLHTCPTCLMSYTRGGPDEAVHAKHHGRVVRGIPWDGLGRGVKRTAYSASGAGGAATSGGGGRSFKGAALTRTGSGGLAMVQSGPGWREVDEVRMGEKGEGRVRVIECDAGYGGAKLEEILSMIDISLSSPPLPAAILERCKLYLAITSSPPPTRAASRNLTPSERSLQFKNKAEAGKERVVGAVLSQGIKWAMRVLEADIKVETSMSAQAESTRTAKQTAKGATTDQAAPRSHTTGTGTNSNRHRQTLLRMSARTMPSMHPTPCLDDAPVAAGTAHFGLASGHTVLAGPDSMNNIDPLVSLDRSEPFKIEEGSMGGGSKQAISVVDSGDGVMCDPTPLPTQLGIHRLYTIPSYRSFGIGEALLDAACMYTIYACPARPDKGQVAFSQPTQSGARMMRRWGEGKVRVFVDDESQI